MFSLTCAIVKKVLSYGASRDDWGQTYQSLHTAWVQVMYVPRKYTKVKIGEPSMYRHSLETRKTERSSMGRKIVRLT
jgi:hypothetical protein